MGAKGDSGTFAGSFVSPNGAYTLTVTDAGIVMTGPKGSVTVGPTGVVVVGPDGKLLLGSAGPTAH